MLFLIFVGIVLYVQFISSFKYWPAVCHITPFHRGYRGLFFDCNEPPTLEDYPLTVDEIYMDREWWHVEELCDQVIPKLPQNFKNISDVATISVRVPCKFLSWIEPRCSECSLACRWTIWGKNPYNKEGYPYYRKIVALTNRKTRTEDSWTLEDIQQVTLVLKSGERIPVGLEHFKKTDETQTDTENEDEEPSDTDDDNVEVKPETAVSQKYDGDAIELREPVLSTQDIRAAFNSDSN